MFGITLEDLKSYLGYEQYDTSRDVQLQVMLDAGFAALKQVVGRNLERGTYRDIFQYRAPKMYVVERPVTSFTSVSIGDRVIPSSDYMEFLQSGLVFFKSPLEWRETYIHAESELITIEYEGGYADLPGDMKLALFSAIQAADQAQQQFIQYGGTVKRLSVYDVGVVDLAIPRDAMQSTMVSSLKSNLSHYSNADTYLGAWMLKESILVELTPEA